MTFNGRIVWITGASSGLGMALARTFAGEGAQLALSARNLEMLEAVRSGCHGGSRHLVVPFDLGDPDSTGPAAEVVLRRFGHVDVLVNNAGVTQRSMARDTTLAVDRRIMEVNYFGPIALAKAVLPSMIDRRSGRIVVISSVVGHVGTPLRSAYAASKHALHGFFESLRAEVHSNGVKVTIVCPGFLQTDISLHALTGDGSAYGRRDEGQEKGMAADVCARKILDAIRRDKDEVAIGGVETWAIALQRFSPALFRRIVRTARVK